VGPVKADTRADAVDPLDGASMEVAAEAPLATSSLRRKVALGLGWKMLGQVFAQVTSVAVGILLAHLLDPPDFGLAGMALVFTGIVYVFTDLALGAALVQRDSITEEDRSTAFWTSLAAGALLTVIGIALAPVVADFFSRPAVEPLFIASSMLALLSSLSVTQSALLTREMNFRGLEIRGMVSAVAGAGAAVVLALAGAGAWTIVGQVLVGATVSTFLLWRLSPWRPKLVYSLQSLRSLGSFGVKTLGSQLLGYLNDNMDNLLVGRYLGSSALGVYAVAYNVMFLPVGRISRPIQQVVFAAFSKLQHESRRLNESWLRGTLLVSAINVPVFAGMIVVAPDFVPTVLGHKWHAAVPVLQLLCLAGIAQTFQTLNWSTVQATGDAGIMLRLRLVGMPLTRAAFGFGLRWGVVGVAGLFAGARAVILCLSTAVTCRVLRFPVLRFVRESAAVAALSAVMVAVVFGARVGLVHVGVGTAMRLALLVALGCVVYVALVRWRTPDLIDEVRSLLRSR